MTEHAGRLAASVQGVPEPDTRSAPAISLVRHSRLDIDQARLLPHLRPQAEVRLTPPDADHLQPINTLAFTWTPEELRGIPVIGHGVGGVSPGTQPEAETIRRSEPRRRR